uniref:Uncharacterized protein n=1 Tax=Anguilla anguilla TaxID=7936 RepID=A0A0E9UN61_ANGAN
MLRRRARAVFHKVTLLCNEMTVLRRYRLM